MPRLIVKDNIRDPKLRTSVELLVNGLVLGHFHPRGETEFAIAEGLHSIRLRVANELRVMQHFLIKERETVTFECEVAGIFRRRFSLKEKGRQRAVDRFPVAASRSRQRSLNGAGA